MRRDILNSEPHQIAGAELAIDGSIEESQVAKCAIQLQAGANCPDVLRLERRFGSYELSLVPWLI
jgi:hypothetical protein